MNKSIFLIFPALFLLLGATTAESSQKALDDLKSTLETSKEMADTNSLNATEITLKEKVVLQGKTNLKIEKRVFKFNLPEDKEYFLYDQEDFIPTEKTKVSWKWEELLGAYYYEISVELNKAQNYLLITITPVERDELPGPSYTTFYLKSEDSSILFAGSTYGTITYTFDRPILYIDEYIDEE